MSVRFASCFNVPVTGVFDCVVIASCLPLSSASFPLLLLFSNDRIFKLECRHLLMKKKLFSSFISFFFCLEITFSYHPLKHIDDYKLDKYVAFGSNDKLDNAVCSHVIA